MRFEIRHYPGAVFEDDADRWNVGATVSEPLFSFEAPYPMAAMNMVRGELRDAIVAAGIPAPGAGGWASVGTTSWGVDLRRGGLFVLAPEGHITRPPLAMEDDARP